MRRKPGFVSLALFLMISLGFAQNDRLTLRLAVADAAGRTTHPQVIEFVNQVRTLSDRRISIEIIWGAGYDTAAYYEAGVVDLVTSGEADLGLTASRAWDNAGVTSFQALQAPFLITDDALAEAVAASDIATRMLEGMSPAGVVGLTLWPEDLRHPFAFDISGRTLLSPEDFAGTTIRALPSSVTWALIEALGATPIFKDGDDFGQDVVDGRIHGAESGLLQGASLPVASTAVGNVVFYPKFQVLFANGDAFEQLNEEQQLVIRDAAAAAQAKAIAEHPRQVDAAVAWCADGGTIVLASEEQVAAFEEAARPVFEQLERDPVNAEFIAAIRDLKARTESSPGVEACAPEAGAQRPDPRAELEVWSEGLPPNGVWSVSLTQEDLRGQGISAATARDWAGTYTWTLQDGKATTSAELLNPYRCEATYQVVDDIVRFTYTDGSDCIGEIDDMKWRLRDDGLHFHLVAIMNAPYAENKAYLEAKPWQKVE